MRIFSMRSFSSSRRDPTGTTSRFHGAISSICSDLKPHSLGASESSCLGILKGQASRLWFPSDISALFHRGAFSEEYPWIRRSNGVETMQILPRLITHGEIGRSDDGVVVLGSYVKNPSFSAHIFDRRRSNLGVRETPRFSDPQGNALTRPDIRGMVPTGSCPRL